MKKTGLSRYWPQGLGDSSNISTVKDVNPSYPESSVADIRNTTEAEVDSAIADARNYSEQWGRNCCR